MNGFAESAVCTLKAQVRKATWGKTDWERALTINNAMQRPDKSGSPSEIFFQRDVRIPGLASLPKKKSGFKEAQEVRSRNRDKQTSREQAYRSLEKFSVGETAVMRDDKMKLWTVPVLITATRDHGSGVRSYFCKNQDSGKSVSRNERLLRKMVKKAPRDGDIIRSRRVTRYRPPPALPKVRACTGYRKKKPAHIRFSSVTEVAWSNTDSHHIEESDPTKRFQ